MSLRIGLGAAAARIRAVHVREGAGAEPLDGVVAHVRARTVAELETACRQRAAGALDEAVLHLEELRHDATSALAHAAAELAFAIARRLLYAEIDAGRYDLERMVRETLEAASAGRGPCVVHLHPEDARKLESVPFRSGTRIQADIGVSRGSVHVETPMGLMVRELDSALDAIAERVREELG